MPIHACTLVSRSASAVLQHIENLAGRFTRHTLLFALSPNVAATELSSIVSNVTALSNNSVGCLAAPTHGPDLITCSLAFFDADSCIPFRSTIAGTPIPQVGRWHSFRKKDELSDSLENVDWEDVWSRRTSTVPLPDQLQGVDPAGINAVVYFTDSSPQGLTTSLSQLSNAARLGLIATSTPFITGRPFTMLHNKDIYDSGAVGLALINRPRLTSTLDFLGLSALSEPMTVTQSEGNLVNTLDGRNPTQLLLDALKKKGMDVATSRWFKDEEQFYVVHGKRAYTITAGDPSRGTISLSGEDGPGVGTKVQFYARQKAHVHEIPDPSSSITFLVSEENKAVYQGDSGSGFVAASENGFVYGDHSICKVPGGVARLSF
ncbi:hypothetical protein BDZ89DRAFT_962168 [Hymenopellis radicata]|nr:hypothetical protein BDZ89DRAFT_962168 [Hymenopellis radicata]